MKKIALFLLCLSFIQCGDKKENAQEGATKSTATAKKLDGKALFTSKTCVTCHALDQKIIGPSIKDMVATYDKENGNFVQFLKGKAAPIMEESEANIAIMKANLTGILKDASPDELQALASYMRSAAEE